MKSPITLIINRSEITAGTRGASLGPEAILTAARDVSSNTLDALDSMYIEDENRSISKVVDDPYARRIESYQMVFNRMKTAISGELSSNHFPLVLSADHGSAAGTVAGIKRAFPDKRLGIIWVDAHADLHSPYTTPSGNVHGMPIALIVGEDNHTCKINDPKPHSIEIWNDLKFQCRFGTPTDFKDIVYVALRDFESPEAHLLAENHVSVLSVSEFRKIGSAAVVRQTLQLLEHCDMLYVSFDVDSMDPEQTSSGTGTPVKGGLYAEEAQDLLNGLALSPKLVAAEFVEVNPCLDNKQNRMAEITFGLIENFLSHLKKS
jgi:arginase